MLALYTSSTKRFIFVNQHHHHHICEQFFDIQILVVFRDTFRKSRMYMREARAQSTGKK